METPKRRKPNWSKDETLMLTELVGPQKAVLEGKFGSGISSSRKRETGETITPQLNAQMQNHRSKEEVEKKSKNLKAQSRKSFSTFHRQTVGTGETYRSLGYQFRVGETTIGSIIPETCKAIYDVLALKYMKCPKTESEWLAVAERFHSHWNFPNCIGALDGKHVNIKPPMNSGSVYFNYKHNFSIVLMALVDADYKFLYVDVGCNGRVSDGGVFRGCSLDEALQKKTANLPTPKPAPGDDRPISFAFVADEAFPLREYILKPYPQRNLTLEKRVFNYRLSRARRVVENAFGILANRFRVLLTNIALSPDKVIHIVLACCCLHNMLRTEIGASSFLGIIDTEDSATHDVHPGQWRNDTKLRQASLPQGTNTTQRAKAHREYMCAYVNSSIGAVPWQWSKA